MVWSCVRCESIRLLYWRSAGNLCNERLWATFIFLLFLCRFFPEQPPPPMPPQYPVSSVEVTLLILSQIIGIFIYLFYAYIHRKQYDCNKRAHTFRFVPIRLGIAHFVFITCATVERQSEFDSVGSISESTLGRKGSQGAFRYQFFFYSLSFSNGLMSTHHSQLVRAQWRMRLQARGY